MLKRPPIGVLTAVLLMLSLLRVAIAENATDYPRRPKLVLILVIDQFRYDYLVRFRPQFVEGGFNLLLNGGANFADCRYDYATTATGPGHATLLTGAYANLHGIIGNEWYEPTLRRTVYCVEDLTTKLVTEPDRASVTPGLSPHYLIGSTLGDELRAATDFRSKVVAISLKDRAAETTGANGQTLGEFRGMPEESCPDPKFLGWLQQTPYMPAVCPRHLSPAQRRTVSTPSEGVTSSWCWIPTRLLFQGPQKLLMGALGTTIRKYLCCSGVVRSNRASTSANVNQSTWQRHWLQPLG